MARAERPGAALGCEANAVTTKARNSHGGIHCVRRPLVGWHALRWPSHLRAGSLFPAQRLNLHCEAVHRCHAPDSDGRRAEAARALIGQLGRRPGAQRAGDDGRADRPLLFTPTTARPARHSHSKRAVGARVGDDRRRQRGASALPQRFVPGTPDMNSHRSDRFSCFAVPGRRISSLCNLALKGSETVRQRQVGCRPRR